MNDELTLKQKELDSAKKEKDQLEAQLSDLKQSVNIKLSAADDLQKILNQSRIQYRDIYSENEKLKNEND